MQMNTLTIIVISF